MNFAISRLIALIDLTLLLCFGFFFPYLIFVGRILSSRLMVTPMSEARLSDGCRQSPPHLSPTKCLRTSFSRRITTFGARSANTSRQSLQARLEHRANAENWGAEFGRRGGGVEPTDVVCAGYSRNVANVLRTCEEPRGIVRPAHESWHYVMPQLPCLRC